MVRPADACGGRADQGDQPQAHGPGKRKLMEVHHELFGKPGQPNEGEDDRHHGSDYSLCHPVPAWGH